MNAIVTGTVVGIAFLVLMIWIEIRERLVATVGNRYRSAWSSRT